MYSSHVQSEHLNVLYEYSMSDERTDVRAEDGECGALAGVVEDEGEAVVDEQTREAQLLHSRCPAHRQQRRESSRTLLLLLLLDK